MEKTHPPHLAEPDRSHRAGALPAEPGVADAGATPRAALLQRLAAAPAQRRQLAARLTLGHSNRQLQRLLGPAATLQRQDAGVGSMPLASPAGPAVIPPELRTSVDLTALGDEQLQARADLIAATLMQFNESNADTALLQEEAERIRRLQGERQVEAQVRATLEGFLASSAAITVVVRWVEDTGEQCVERSREVSVQPPYFMNVTDESRPTAAEATTTRYDTAVANRAAAERATRDLLAEAGRPAARGGMGLARAMVGKAEPEDIQRILQAAVDRRQVGVGPDAERPNAEDLRAWLARYGIGVDCSAFVSQALNLVVEDVGGAPLAAGERLSRGSGQLRGGATGFTTVASPAELRPGDTMHIPGHIRIVTAVRRDSDGAVIFSTAESHSGGSSVGPEGGEWRYHEGALQLRRSPDEPWENQAGGNITYGRYERLAEAMGRAAE